MEKHTLKMSAFYYAFKPTGELIIDKILSQVARAGDAYHHTAMWSEPRVWAEDARSYIEHIQMAADEAAEQVRTLLANQAKK